MRACTSMSSSPGDHSRTAPRARRPLDGEGREPVALRRASASRSSTRSSSTSTPSPPIRSAGAPARSSAAGRSRPARTTTPVHRCVEPSTSSASMRGSSTFVVTTRRRRAVTTTQAALAGFPLDRARQARSHPRDRVGAAQRDGGQPCALKQGAGRASLPRPPAAGKRYSAELFGVTEHRFVGGHSHVCDRAVNGWTAARTTYVRGSDRRSGRQNRARTVAPRGALSRPERRARVPPARRARRGRSGRPDPHRPRPAVGVSKSTAYAILQTTAGRRLRRRFGAGMSRRYRLGMALARLGDVVVSQIALRDVAMPVLRDLAREARLTVAGRGARRALRRRDRARRRSATARSGSPRTSASESTCTAPPSASPCSRRCRDDGAVELAAAGMPGKTPHTITDERALARRARRGWRSAATRSTTRRTSRGSSASAPPFVDHSAHCVGAISVTGLKLDLPSWQCRAARATFASTQTGSRRCSALAARTVDGARSSSSEPGAIGLPSASDADPGPGEVVTRSAYCGSAAPISSCSRARSTPRSFAIR